MDRISSKLIEYTSKFDWNRIKFPSSSPDYQRFERFNDHIALNISFVPFNEQDIKPEYVSKHNFTRKVQISLLKITDGEGKWHFLALKSNFVNNSDHMNCQKSFSRLMRGISSNVHENNYCSGCFHSFRSQSTLEKHSSLCKEHTFCITKFPMGNDRIKKYKKGSKTIKINDVIYVDLECILPKYDTYSNSFNKSHTTSVSQHIPSGYSICIVRHHNRSSETKYYHGRDCIEKLCKELKQISNNIVNTKGKEHIPLSEDQLNAHAIAKTCYICDNHFNNHKKSSYYKNFKKVVHHNHYTGLYGYTCFMLFKVHKATRYPSCNA